MVGMYNSESTFLNKTYKSARIKAQKGNLQVVFENIPKGMYAISLYHDTDTNEELNTFWGIPTEPYGISNNAKGMFGPPKWENAKFNVVNTITEQSIKL